MDFSTMSAASFGGSSMFASSVASTGSSDPNRDKQFYEWHSKQGITAPQDYPLYASQPTTFEVVQQNPDQPTAASPYLRKIMTQQATGLGAMGGDDYSSDMPAEGRRKTALKKSAPASPPMTPGAYWPKSMFGTRPPTRMRGRSSATPDDLAHHGAESNLPPLASIYDEFPHEPVMGESLPQEASWTPTQVRVANFSEERFPDLIRALRQYYGPILETYSGLPDAEHKFPDPDIIPREQLDATTLQMVQPLMGSDGGPGPWVRVTFRDREAAERAVAASEHNEFEVGARVIRITFWDQDPVRDVPSLPFATPQQLGAQMDIDLPASPTPRRNSTSAVQGSTPGLRRRATAVGGAEEAVGGEVNGTGEYSDFMPGAKLIAPKQVEFAKKDGWLSGWTNSLVGAPTAVAPGGSVSWFQSLVRFYRWIMDDVVGFKYL